MVNYKPSSMSTADQCSALAKLNGCCIPGPRGPKGPTGPKGQDGSALNSIYASYNVITFPGGEEDDPRPTLPMPGIGLTPFNTVASLLSSVIDDTYLQTTLANGVTFGANGEFTVTQSGNYQFNMASSVFWERPVNSTVFSDNTNVASWSLGLYVGATQTNPLISSDLFIQPVSTVGNVSWSTVLNLTAGTTYQMAFQELAGDYTGSPPPTVDTPANFENLTYTLLYLQ